MSETAPETPASSPSLPNGERVESWKGIAAYLGRDVRTVQRWEKQEGLPVHRHIHNKLSTVYAFKSELDSWWHERGIRIDNGQTAAEIIDKDRAGRWLTLERLGFLLVLAVTLGAWLLSPRSTVQLPLRRFAFAPKEPVVVARISPNGKHIVYTTQDKTQSVLWIQDLDRVEPRRISGAEGAQFPFWSPDSRLIGYGTKTELRSVPVIRGSAVTICQLPREDQPFLGGTWLQTGQSIVFCQDSRRFFEVPARGGTPKVLGEVDLSSKISHVEFPHALPGGNQFVFMFKGVGQPHKIGVYSVDSGKHEVVAPDGICPSFCESGHILFSSRSPDWNYGFIGAVPFSPSAGRVTGDTFHIATNGSFPSTSKDGTLVYVENTAMFPPRQLVWRDRAGRKVEIVGQVPDATMEFALSPDQRKLALSRIPSPQLIIRDLVLGTEISLTSKFPQFGALWTPDGSALTFAVARGGNHDLVLLPARAGGEETILWATDADELPGDWSPDGRFLIYSVRHSETPSDLWYLKRKDDGKGYVSFPFIRTQHKESSPRFSMDGRSVAFTSDEFGRSEVFVTSFPENSGRLKVSTNGGENPSWSKDGKELYYVEGQTLMAVSIGPGPQKVFGSPLRLFEDPRLNHQSIWNPYVASLDRQRFLVIEATGDAPPPVIRVVQNWYSEFTAHD